MRQPKCQCGSCRYCKKRAEYLAHKESYILRSQQYQKENKEQTNRKNAQWKRDNRDKVLASQSIRRIRLKSEGRQSDIDRRHDLSKYGTTPDWWDTKFEEQGRAYGICGCTKNNATNRRMHVDHSHSTMYNRGILCHSCNAALERMESIEGWAIKAQIYLDKYEQEYQQLMELKYGHLNLQNGPPQARSR